MLEKIKPLIRNHDVCVLATAQDNTPHCSLMAYVSSDDCRKLYMATSRNTRKYSNIQRNPQVSVLIDSRENMTANRLDAKALTIAGICAPMAEDAERDAARASLLERHPHLKELLSADDADILEIEIGSLLLLDGVSESYFERLDAS